MQKAHRGGLVMVLNAKAAAYVNIMAQMANYVKGFAATCLTLNTFYAF